MKPSELQPAACPALLISAPASGQGKTMFTAALARYHRNQGRKVRVFKTGPDFLDPMLLAQASGQAVYQLDLWMVGKDACKALLYAAACDADLILIEGVMGLFDGTPSSADLALEFGVPVATVIDASAMAQTFAAIAFGLAGFDSKLPFAGVIANRVAGESHARMLKDGLPPTIPFLGAIHKEMSLSYPERHLGLVQADEKDDLESMLDAAAVVIERAGITDLPAPVNFAPIVQKKLEPLLSGVRIGIARDNAFAFIYSANLDVLRELGAELVFFSPLTDSTLPEVNSLWFPGGYPELHLQTLQNNTGMKEVIRRHHQQGKPLIAECGGMLYLFDGLTDKQGERGEMLGLLAGEAVMQKRLMGLGFQLASLAEGELTAHTFHHSSLQTTLQPDSCGQRQQDNSTGEAIYRQGRLLASYLHLYFPSNPEAIAALLKP